MKLTAKFITAFLLVSLIPVAVLGYISYGSAKKALENQATEDLVVIAEGKEGHVYSFLEAVKARAVDFSSDGFIRDSVDAMQKLDAKDPRYTELQKALNAHLKLDKQPLDKSVHTIGVIDLNGRIIASTEEVDIGLDESDDDYFIHGKEGVYISDVYISPHILALGHPPHIAVSAPLISRETGRLLGIIVNYYDIHELSKILSGEFQIERGALMDTRGRRETLEIYLVNRNGFMITESRFKEDVLLKQVVETESVRRCIDGEEFTGIYTNYLNVEVIGTSMCIPSMGWALISEISTAEAFAPVTALKRGMIVLGAVITILVAVFAYLAATSLARPALRLSSATRKIARGDFEVSMPVESSDEIGELTMSFNRMAAQLKDLYSDIKEREERHRTLVESSTDAIISIDEGRVITLWNKAAERIFGYSEGEALGKPLTLIIPEEYRELHKKGFKRYLETGESKVIGKTVELEGLNRKGSKFPIELSLSSMKTRDCYVFTAIIRDITERKDVEERTKQYLEDLKRFAKAAAGREERIAELKERIKELEGRK